MFQTRPPTGMHSLSLHDALPIYDHDGRALEAHQRPGCQRRASSALATTTATAMTRSTTETVIAVAVVIASALRSEEHTSEIQSLTNLVCRLLVEKKNKVEGDPRA